MPTNPKLLTYARQLRNHPTKAEKKMWYEALSKRQFQGYRFLRQKIIGNYIVDFYCPKLKLIIEIDGKSHDYDDALVMDSMREKKLVHSGYHVIRFSDQEIFDQGNVVYEKLSKKIMELTDCDAIQSEF